MLVNSSKALTQAEQDLFWMQYAYRLAQKAESEGEVPVGAVIVENGNRVAEGWNQTIQNYDPTAHAEIVALRAAGQVLQNYRLGDLTLYVTLEPCPMCASAMVLARIKRLVVATKDPRTGSAGSVFNLTQDARLNHHIEVEFGVLEADASAQLKSFFKQKRSRKKDQVLANVTAKDC